MQAATTSKTDVACFLSSLIDKCGKSRKEIASESGFGKPNIISMLKTGDTKLPLARLGSFAKSVNTDPVQLLRMCLQEYYPDVWGAITCYLDASLTSDELRMIKALRTATGSPYLASLNAEERDRLDDFLKLLTQSKTVH